MIRHRAPIPETWLDVKTVLLMKPEATDPDERRPIYVASVFWRTSMAAITKNITEWSDQWIPEQIVGGVRGRDPDDLNAILTDLVESTWHGDGFLAGLIQML